MSSAGWYSLCDESDLESTNAPGLFKTCRNRPGQPGPRDRAPSEGRGPFRAPEPPPGSTCRSQAQRLLAPLASRGWLARAARGLYTVVPLETEPPHDCVRSPARRGACVRAGLCGWMERLRTLGSDGSGVQRRVHLHGTPHAHQARGDAGNSVPAQDDCAAEALRAREGLDSRNPR